MEGMDIYMHDPTIRSLIGLIIAIISVYIIYNVIKKLRKMKDSLNDDKK